MRISLCGEQPLPPEGAYLSEAPVLGVYICYNWATFFSFVHRHTTFTKAEPAPCKYRDCTQ
jgi:hypothetical protein